MTGRKPAQKNFYITTYPRLAPEKLRLILVRNGESCNRLAPDWHERAFDDGYKMIDSNQPVKVPISRPHADFKHDDFLTNVGLFTAETVGRYMEKIQLSPSAVISSPALRCVQSATALLKKSGDKTTKILIEPGLYEPMLFHKKCPPLMTLNALEEARFPVNTNHDPIMSLDMMRTLATQEGPHDFYNRVGQVVRTIMDGFDCNKEGTVIIVTHAPVIDAILRYMLRLYCPWSIADVIRLGVRYPFSGTVVLERDLGNSEKAKGKTWTLNPYVIPSFHCGFTNLQVEIPEVKPFFGAQATKQR
ncbi:unnamed protein product [Bursaphelenchus xylophilus]|uniref:(pine wood nematode) hypothetical protein n=1 Tax=Bursaphelenchus xylophilus TaxID=6326 RepID=A0A1I7RST0_BURXY|nr:unnamed protein product [Bursaphelenchus xylophilus]CAG9122813.1 unnamed protein product [Bursaphelenchus xylophilus]